MASLTAWYRGPNGESHHLWTIALPAGQTVSLGRAANAPDDYRSDLGVDDPRVPVDHQNHVSFKHATLTWDGRAVRIRSRTHPKPPTNAIHHLHNGEKAPAEFELIPGQGFRIPAFFEFLLTAPAVPPPPAPTPPVVKPAAGFSNESRPDFSSEVAGDIPGSDSGSFDTHALVQELRWIIGQGDLDHSEDVLADLFLARVFKLVPATHAAIISCPLGDGEAQPLHVYPSGQSLPFSRRLVREVAAHKTGKMVGWASGGEGAYSVDASTEWAVCLPVPSYPGEARRFVLYATGHSQEYFLGSREFTADPGLRQVCKLLDLMAGVYSIFARLGRQQAELRQLKRFMPRPVRNRSGPLDKILDPQVVPVAVLFCDIRGSCGLAEGGNDNLDAYWRQILRPALEFMAEAVVNHEGVIGSFLGDAVMAFWGWPDADPQRSENAARAALEIRWKFMKERERSNSLIGRLGFGIGIATGPAIAGRLGTPEQHKVDVIGPTVNLASRIEGLTKIFGATILIDRESLAGVTAAQASRCRTRRIGWVLPYGIDKPVELFELMPLIDDFDVAPKPVVCERYERALHLFEQGDWRQASKELEPIIGIDSPSQKLSAIIAARDAPPTGPSAWPRVSDTDSRCALRFDTK